jgi:PAS domain S-box-containing protein
MVSNSSPAPEHLTLGERQVIDLALAGATNKEIARRLGIGVRTVERRRATALDRLGVQTLVEAARLVSGQPNGRSGTFDAALSLAMPAALFDRQGCIVAVNTGFCEVFGRPEAEFLRLPEAELTHPDDRADELERVRRLFSGETESYRAEKRMLTSRGTYLRLRFAVSTVWGDDGKPCFGLAQLVGPRTN